MSKFMNTFNDVYGLMPMTFDEEINLPSNIRGVRLIKIDSINKLYDMIKLCETQILRVKGMQEIDDSKYLDLLLQYNNRINETHHALFSATQIGKC